MKLSRHHILTTALHHPCSPAPPPSSSTAHCSPPPLVTGTWPSPPAVPPPLCCGLRPHMGQAIGGGSHLPKKIQTRTPGIEGPTSARGWPDLSGLKYWRLVGPVLPHRQSLLEFRLSSAHLLACFFHAKWVPDVKRKQTVLTHRSLTELIWLQFKSSLNPARVYHRVRSSKF
jgi:hypothetical protein